jgi:flagellar basal-body rod protein FlgG
MEPDPTPGPPVPTGRWLDVAIEGNGYLILDDPASRAPDMLGYTRSGRLYINPYRELVYGGPDGPRVEPIVIFPDEYRDLRITPTGRIEVQPMDGRAWHPVGQLHLARFANEAGLHPAVTGRFTATAESGPPRVAEPGHLGLGTLKQKHLEGSNVDLAAELAELEHLKQWGTSLAAALGVEPGFPQLPAVDLQHIAGPPADAPYPYSRPAPRTRLSAGR